MRKTEKKDEKSENERTDSESTYLIQAAMKVYIWHIIIAANFRLMPLLRLMKIRQFLLNCLFNEYR